jgi:hypothetical protein
MMAQQCDLEPGDFVWTGGDTHLYSNHLEQTRLQLSREPRALPRSKSSVNPHRCLITASMILKSKATIRTRRLKPRSLSDRTQHRITGATERRFFYPHYVFFGISSRPFVTRCKPASLFRDVS